MSKRPLKAAVSACAIGAGLLLAVGFPTATLADGSASAPGAPQAPAPDCSGLTCFLLKLRGEPLSSQPAAAPPAPMAPVAESKTAQPPVPKKQFDSSLSIAGEAADPARLHALIKTLSHANVRAFKAREDKADGAVKLTQGDRQGGDLKLYGEQVHIIARNAIASVDDLKGKTVSFGTEPNARSLVQAAFSAISIPVNETPLDFANAVDGLATGDVDAVVLIAPAPSPEVAALKSSGVHLLDWPAGDPAIARGTTDRLANSMYPGLIAADQTVSAMHVDAVFRATDVGRRHHADRLLGKVMAKHRNELAKAGFEFGPVADLGKGRLASVDER